KTTLQQLVEYARKFLNPTKRTRTHGSRFVSLLQRRKGKKPLTLIQFVSEGLAILFKGSRKRKVPDSNCVQSEAKESADMQNTNTESLRVLPQSSRECYRRLALVIEPDACAI